MPLIPALDISSLRVTDDFASLELDVGATSGAFVQNQSEQVPWKGVEDYITWGGVQIYIKSINETHKKRVHSHEYQNNVDPYVENVGRSPTEWSFSGFLIGPDSRTDARRLVNAADNSIAAETIFPSVGEPRLTEVKSCKTSEVLGKNYLIEVEITFIEKGSIPVLDIIEPDLNTRAAITVTEVEEIERIIVRNPETGFIKPANQLYDYELLDYAVDAVSAAAGLFGENKLTPEDVGCRLKRELREGYPTLLNSYSCSDVIDLQSPGGYDQLRETLYEDSDGPLRDVSWLEILERLSTTAGEELFNEVQSKTLQTRNIDENTPGDTYLAQIQADNADDFRFNSAQQIRLHNNIYSANKALEMMLQLAVKKFSEEIDSHPNNVSQTIINMEVFNEARTNHSVIKDLNSEALEEHTRTILNDRKDYVLDRFNAAFRAVYNNEYYTQGVVPEFAPGNDAEERLRVAAFGMVELTFAALDANIDQDYGFIVTDNNSTASNFLPSGAVGAGTLTPQLDPTTFGEVLDSVFKAITDATILE